jgi:hypothetical protein
VRALAATHGADFIHRSAAASDRRNVLGVDWPTSDQKFAQAADRELLCLGLTNLEPSDNNSADSQCANGCAADGERTRGHRPQRQATDRDTLHPDLRQPPV